MENASSASGSPPANLLSKLLTLVGIVVVIAGLYLGRHVLIPLALAIVLAFLLQPAVRLAERARLGRVPAVLIVFALSFALLGGLGWLVTKQVSEIMEQLSSYQANVHNKIDALRRSKTGGLNKATAAVNDLSRELSAASQGAASKKTGPTSGARPIPVQPTTPPKDVSDYLRDMIGPLASVLEIAAITAVFTLFILIKREDVRNRVIRLAGIRQLNLTTQALDEGATRLSKFLLLQFCLNALFGLFFGLGVYLIGVPHALLWGVLACILRFVPYVGTTFAASFPLVLAFAIDPGWKGVLLVFALFLFLELTLANLIEPWLYGSHLGVSSLAMLVAAVFWGMLWGPVGVVLSTSLTVCLILMGRYVPQLDFLEVLLGDEPVLSPQAHFYQRLLAFDENEAHAIAEKFVQENSVEDFYDSVLIPALSLAEQDRHTNGLDESRVTFIQESTREIIDEFDQRPIETEQTGSEPPKWAGHRRRTSSVRIFCLPSRDEADEIVGNMLVQLLRRSGYDAQVFPIGAVSAMLEGIEKHEAHFVCLSALPPFAAGQALPLCRRLRQGGRSIRIILGLWAYPGGLPGAQQRVGSNCTDSIAISLKQVLSLVERHQDRAATVPVTGAG